MRHLRYLFAAAAIGSLMVLPQTSSASPLVGGLTSGNARLPELSEGLVQKVHGWHCGKKKGWYHGKRYWHRHSKACHRRYHRSYYYDDDYDDDYYDYSYHRPYRYHAYPYYPGPFIGFSFGGGHRGWGWDDD
jgi:hypothetical protein